MDFFLIYRIKFVYQNHLKVIIGFLHDTLNDEAYVKDLIFIHASI